MNGISKMNESEVIRFSRLIRARLAALEEENALGEQGQSIVQLDQQAVGRLSRMDALQGQAMAEATHARRAAERRQLKAALRRIEAGMFGLCDDCGEEIAAKRLLFNPAITLCIACASGG